MFWFIWAIRSHMKKKEILNNHTPLQPITEEQAHTARMQQLRKNRNMMILNGVITFLTMAVFLVLCVVYIIKSNNHHGYGLTLVYTSHFDTMTYYQTRTIALGSLAGITFLFGLYFVILQAKHRKWLKDPATPGFLIYYSPRHHNKEVTQHIINRYNAGLQMYNANNNAGQFDAPPSPPKYEQDNLNSYPPVTQPPNTYIDDTNQHGYPSMRMPNP